MTMADGRLYFVVGASGAGKDTLIRYAREHRDRDAPVVFAHRYITRPATAGGENHIALDEHEFRLRQRLGLLAMHWESHGLYYGIGVEINVWLAAGLSVVVNGSRAYLPLAHLAHPDLCVVWVHAEPERVAARLLQRRRESGEQIDRRLRRNPEPVMPPGCAIVRIDNNGTPAQAGERLLALFSAGSGPDRLAG